MDIKIYNGDITKCNADIIAHQVNCKFVMGGGVALALRKRWPVVYKNYIALGEECDKSSEEWLGTCQIVKIDQNRYVANLFGQDKYGYDNKRYTSYDGIYDALTSLAVQMMDNGMKSLAFPYKMSSDRGGADWNVILAMIESIFKNTNISIEIWELEQS
jgi:O-acetyl-ADP-ribose deacetylase (regulator of RNase III)